MSPSGSVLAISLTTADGEQVLEGPAKVDVKDGVNDRIECGVDIAEPYDRVDDAIVGDSGTVPAERKYDVHEEERKPTDDERSHDDGHRARSSTLLRQRDALFLRKELVHLSTHSDALRVAATMLSFSLSPLYTCG